MPIDPNINLRAFTNQPDPMQSYGQALALKNFAAKGKMEQMQQQELARQLKENAAQRQALSAGIVPQQTQQVQIPGVDLGQYGNTGASTDSLTTPAHMDRNKTLAAFAGNPDIAYKLPEVQGQFAQQDAAQTEAQHKDALSQIDMAIKSGQLDEQKRKVLSEGMDQVGKAAMVLKSVPQEQRSTLYPRVLATLRQSGNPVVNQILQSAPQQYTPEMDGQLDVWASHAAQVGDLTKTAFPEPRKPVPGVDVPLSPAVQAQKIQIAQQSRPPAAEVAPGLDDAAINQAAAFYSTTGQMPALGMGKQAAELRAKIMNRAAQINPSAILADNKQLYGAKQGVIKDFTSGTAAKALTSFATASHHLDTLEEAANALDSGNLKALNSLANAYHVSTGDTPIAAYKAVQQVVAGDVNKAIAASGTVSEGEMQIVRDAVDPSLSTPQKKTAINALRELMAQKRAAMKAQYDQGMTGNPNFGQNGQDGGMTITLPSGKTVKIN